MGSSSTFENAERCSKPFTLAVRDVSEAPSSDLSFLVDQISPFLDGTYVCGGAAAAHLGIIKEYSDIDLYFKNEATFNLVTERLAVVTELVRVSEWAATYKSPNRPIQCVHPSIASGSIQDILKTFDLNFAQVALTYMHGKWVAFYSDTLLGSHLEVELFHIRNPIHTAWRLGKYMARVNPNKVHVTPHLFAQLFKMWDKLDPEAKSIALDTYGEYHRDP